MDDSSSNRRLVHDVLATAFESAEPGREPELAELIARHPHLAAELTEFFDEQERLQELVEPLRPGKTRLGQPTDPFPGTAGETAARLLGDYVLVRVLARGGMGVVHEARQQSLNRTVALKTLRGDLFAPEDVQRFRREAEVVASLDHPHIVPIYEVGEHDGFCFYSMKVCEGGSLDRRLGEFVADPRAAARLVAEVARAVAHAHERGILHRDLKPSNVLLDAERRPLVADFGLAKWARNDPELTQSGALVGTPPYMPPERAVGSRGTNTVAADVYGLGAVLYAALTGQPPFRGATILETIEQVKSSAPDSPSSVNPRVDRDLETICLKCLEKDPSLRYASASEVAADLERYLSGEPIRARPITFATRVARRCRRPERMRDAGLYVLVLNLSLAGFALSLLAAMLLGFVRVRDLVAPVGYVIRVSVAYYLPLIILGRLIMARKRVALWGSLILAAEFTTLLLLSFLGLAAPNWGGVYEDRLTRLPFELLVSLLTVIEIAACAVGLVASYAEGTPLPDARSSQ